MRIFQAIAIIKECLSKTAITLSSSRYGLWSINFFAVLSLTSCAELNEHVSDAHFIPHGYCLHWNPALVSTMILANIGIATAYFAIPLALWYFVRRKKDLPYPWMFQLFGAFIIACGITHLMKVWTLYQPFYWAEVIADLYTAAISLLTAAVLWPLIPKMLALKGPKDLQDANEKLQEAIVRWQRTTETLQAQAELLNLTHDTILVRDLDGTIRYWNHGGEEMYGYTAAEAVGQKTHIFFDSRFPKPLAEIEEDILTKGRWTGEIIHNTRDGQKIIVSSRQALKTDTQGRPIAVLEINSDITEHKRAEQRQQALIEMERSNSELEQFASIASHDLQEPLRAVAGCLQILEKTYRGKLDDNADQLIDLAVDGAQRMRTLINDLLSLSRISGEGVAFERTDLSQVLEQALKNLDTTIKETGAKVTNDPLPTLSADKSQLTQLFQNLISNAIKFRSDKPPEIHIGAQHNEGQWLISVRDNGIGFEQEYAKRIFEPFKRLHTRDKYPGTGIGLPICKRIVERHSGNIWVESQPGIGTTFISPLQIGDKFHDQRTQKTN